MIGSFFGVLLPSLVFLIIFRSSFSFILSIAVTSFIYWLFVLAHAFYKDWGDAFKFTYNEFIKAFVIIAINIVVMLILKEFVQYEENTINQILGIFFQLFLILLLNFIINKDHLKYTINMIGNKL